MFVVVRTFLRASLCYGSIYCAGLGKVDGDEVGSLNPGDARVKVLEILESLDSYVSKWEQLESNFHLDLKSEAWLVQEDNQLVDSYDVSIDTSGKCRRAVATQRVDEENTEFLVFCENSIYGFELKRGAENSSWFAHSVYPIEGDHSDQKPIDYLVFPNVDLASLVYLKRGVSLVDLLRDPQFKIERISRLGNEPDSDLWEVKFVNLRTARIDGTAIDGISSGSVVLDESVGWLLHSVSLDTASSIVGTLDHSVMNFDPESVVGRDLYFCSRRTVKALESRLNALQIIDLKVSKVSIPVPETSFRLGEFGIPEPPWLSSGGTDSRAKWILVNALLVIAFAYYRYRKSRTVM